MPRDYRKEYDTYHATPEQKKRRAMRNKARREAMKQGKVRRYDNKHIDHKLPIRKGGTNAKGNTRVVSATKNKGWRKGKKGYD